MAAGEGGVDRVAAVVTKAIGDVKDARVRLAEAIKDQLYDVKVHHLAVAAEIVDRASFSFEQGGDDAGAVIAHMNAVVRSTIIVIAEPKRDRTRLRQSFE